MHIPGITSVSLRLNKQAYFPSFDKLKKGRFCRSSKITASSKLRSRSWLYCAEMNFYFCICTPFLGFSRSVLRFPSTHLAPPLIQNLLFPLEFTEIDFTFVAMFLSETLIWCYFNIHSAYVCIYLSF